MSDREHLWVLPDIASRTLVHGSMVRAGILCACVLGAWIVGALPGSQVPARLGLLLTFGGLCAMCLAARNREKPGQGSLNHWDECLALNAAAILLRMLHRMLFSP